MKLLLGATLPPCSGYLRTCPSGAAFVMYAKADGFFLLYKRKKLRFWKGKWLAHETDLGKKLYLIIEPEPY